MTEPPAPDPAEPEPVHEPGDARDGRERPAPEVVPRLRAAARRPALRAAARLVAVGLLALLGGVVGMRLTGPVEHQVGPLDVTAAVSPGSSDTTVQLPPLGTLTLDSHAGPVHVALRVEQLRPEEARAIASDPRLVEGLGDRLTADLQAAVRAATVQAVASFLLGAVLVGALVTRRTRTTLAAAVLAASVAAASVGWALSTVDRKALDEPEFTGLLSSAPALVGDLSSVAQRFSTYRTQLTRIVDTVTTLYAAGSTLPTFSPTDETVRLLLVSDLHLNPAGADLTARLADDFAVDLVVDAGDTTDWGSVAETRVAEWTSRVDVPYVWVRGNHDSLAVQRAFAAQPNAVVLDGQVAEVAGLRLAGEGDPRFTPDASTRGTREEEAEALATTGRALAQLARKTEEAGLPVDAVVVHDPAAAEQLTGVVPLVLSGHRHRRDVDVVDGTTVFTQGSTGGAGLRGLEGEEPTPLTASVLYLDRSSGRLLAWDDVTVGGLGTSSVSVSRRVPEDGGVGAAGTTSPPADPVPEG